MKEPFCTRCEGLGTYIVDCDEHPLGTSVVCGCEFSDLVKTAADEIRVYSKYYPIYESESEEGVKVYQTNLGGVWVGHVDRAELRGLIYEYAWLAMEKKREVKDADGVLPVQRTDT